MAAASAARQFDTLNVPTSGLVTGKRKSVPHRLKMDALRGVFDRLRPDICSGSQPITDLRPRDELGKIFIGTVIFIQHSQPGVSLRLWAGFIQGLEEACFGGPIVLVRTMLVEMFMGNIGDYTDIELTSIHTVLRPTMRSGFEHRMGQPGLDHPGQVALYIRGIRRGDMETGI